MRRQRRSRWIVLAIACLSLACGACCPLTRWIGSDCCGCERSCQQDFTSTSDAFCRESPFNAEACLLEKQLKFTPLIPAGGDYPPGEILDLNNSGQVVPASFNWECFPLIKTQSTTDPISFTWKFDEKHVNTATVSLGDYFKSFLPGSPTVSVTAQRVSSVTVSLDTLIREQTSEQQLSDALESPGFDDTCRQLATTLNTVIETARIGALALSFNDLDDQKIDLSKVAVKDIISFSGGTQATLSDSGTVTFNTPVLVGVRLVRLGNQAAPDCCDENGAALCAAPANAKSCDPCQCDRGLLLPARQGRACFPTIKQ